jgi:flagellar biosynthetic protein FliR
MDTDLVISLAVGAMELALKVALPLLLVGLAVGLIISVFQAVTQIQEQTLTFIPKILATVVVMVVGGPWMLDQLLSYTRDLWTSIPNLIGEQQVVGFFAVLARISPLFVLAPLFSSKSIPTRVRGIVAVALAIGLTPVVVQGAELPTDAWGLAGLLGKEILVGAAYAYTLAALFAALEVAGSFLDTLIGFSFGGLIDPITGNQNAVLARMYSLIGLMIFLAIGGDTWVIQGLARTYEVIGIDQTPAIGTLVAGASQAFASIFLSAIQVAGPIILALILTDAAFGVVSRVVPQLNVFAVGFPAKVTIGLLLIGVTMPFVGAWLAGELQQSVLQALQTLKVA